MKDPEFREAFAREERAPASPPSEKEQACATCVEWKCGPDGHGYCEAGDNITMAFDTCEAFRPRTPGGGKEG